MDLGEEPIGPPPLLLLVQVLNVLGPCLNLRVAYYKDILICHQDVLLFRFLETKKNFR